MRTGLLIGVFFKYIIALLPVVLILFSKLVSGKTKVKWVLAVLLIPYIFKTIIFILVMRQGDALQMHSSIVLGGWAPVIPLIWYISAWSIYFYFKVKYETQKRKKHTKIIAGILLAILVAWSLIYTFNIYKEQEAKTILECGSERFFTKKLEPNKLYSTLNFIHKNSSSYIGILEGNNIILSTRGDRSNVVNHCLKYADSFNIIYPENSKYNKDWAWKKDTYDINSTLLFTSKESVCVTDKRGYDEYLIWKLKYGDNSIKTNRDSIVFKIDKVEHTVKAETIEFSEHFMGVPYSTDEYKYIFRKSIIDSSKIIIWKFSKNGDFIKEVHVKIPNNITIELGRGYNISHISIKKDKIQFRLYESYRGDQKQKWKNMCSYHTLEIENRI